MYGMNGEHEEQNELSEKLKQSVHQTAFYFILKYFLK